MRLLPAHSATSKQRRTKASTGAERRGLRLFSRPGPKERPVLIAGGDPAAREAVLRDLARSLSPDTVVEQAAAVWEVLARAGDSRVVILSGELEDVSAEALMQMLAHRHPGLPVVSLDGPGAGPRESARVAC
ncbi:MAG TPA: hypothetical protein VHW67_02210 [Solirubrobacteraceae bacterium]|nr:hypothetical protein [Solirubrobacteraceae bacterium]